MLNFSGFILGGEDQGNVCIAAIYAHFSGCGACGSACRELVPGGVHKFPFKANVSLVDDSDLELQGNIIECLLALSPCRSYRIV